MFLFGGNGVCTCLVVLPLAPLPPLLLHFHPCLSLWIRTQRQGRSLLWGFPHVRERPCQKDKTQNPRWNWGRILFQNEFLATSRPCKIPVVVEGLPLETEEFQTPSEDSGVCLGEVRNNERWVLFTFRWGLMFFFCSLSYFSSLGVNISGGHGLRRRLLFTGNKRPILLYPTKIAPTLVRYCRQHVFSKTEKKQLRKSIYVIFCVVFSKILNVKHGLVLV